MSFASISSKKITAPGLAGKIVRFAQFLKGRGFRVFQSSVHDALRSLEEIDLSKRNEFFLSLRANLTNSDVEWIQFAKFFDEFWISKNKEKDELARAYRPRKREVDESLSTKDHPLMDVERSASMGHKDEREWLEGVAYSPLSKVEKKDLGSFDKGDIQMAQLAMKKIMEPFRVDFSRRSRHSCRCGNLDFHRIMRNSVKSEGIPLKLFYKEKRKRLKKLVILADVSGSMDQYARFVMPFMLGLRGWGQKQRSLYFLPH